MNKNVDKWIDAIPDDVYSLCPCGCKKKFKFCKDDIEKHEEQFYKNLTTKEINDMVLTT